MTSSSSTRSELLRRVRTASDDALRFCTIPGCGRPPEARQGNGLSPYLCRYHRQFRARHGSPLKRSYTGPELQPYVRAAASFIKAHRADRYIGWSLDRVALGLSGAGPVQGVNDLRWMEPRAKARASLAMLRERKVPAERILALTLGVLAAIEEDTYGPGGDRVLFRRVQIAKALRRRASGSHVVYDSGLRLDRYPRSAGKVLEVLGAIIEKACEFAIDGHLTAVLALKQDRYGKLPIAPQGTVAKSAFGNSRVPKPPPAVSLSAEAKTARQEAEDKEAERIAEGNRDAFAKSGYAGLRGRF
jgi:hypothetical protein